MALTRRGLLFGVGDAHVYEAPEAAKDEGLGFAAQRERARAQVPGCAGSTRAFLAKCVGCQLCIRECRHHVLKVSSRADHLFKPELDFRFGWCPPECSRCGAVCPAGALKPVSEAEKLNAHLGFAKWRRENCLAAKGVTCNACLRHCPVGAIRMERKSEKGKVKTEEKLSLCLWLMWRSASAAARASSSVRRVRRRGCRLREK